MKLADKLFRFRSDINDIERDWYENDEILIDHFNDGLCEIYNIRPEYFAKLITLELDAGDVQTVPDCCVFLRMDGILDEHGHKIANTKLAKKESVSDWGEPSCRNGSSKQNRSYYVDPVLKSNFYVDPPVAKGQQVFVRALASCKPEPFTYDLTQSVDNMDCELWNPIFEWALYRVYSTNIDSGSALAQANLHLNNFYNLMKSRVVTDDKMDKEVAAHV